MPQNDWQKRFGAKRRAIDRALLAECERAIAQDEQQQVLAKRAALFPEHVEYNDSNARETIARIFGRPMQ